MYIEYVIMHAYKLINVATAIIIIILPQVRGQIKVKNWVYMVVIPWAITRVIAQ